MLCPLLCSRPTSVRPRRHDDRRRAGRAPSPQGRHEESRARPLRRSHVGRATAARSGTYDTRVHRRHPAWGGGQLGSNLMRLPVSRTAEGCVTDTQVGGARRMNDALHVSPHKSHRSRFRWATWGRKSDEDISHQSSAQIASRCAWRSPGRNSVADDKNGVYGLRAALAVYQSCSLQVAV